MAIQLRQVGTFVWNNLGAIAVIVVLVFAFFFIGLPLIRARSTVLQNLADQDYARGVITYVITVGTIAIAAALVLGVLVGKDSNAATAAFDKGKEVLVLLVGVLGTILGFYYGAAQREEPELSIAADSIDFAATDSLRITAHVAGGESPCTYRLTVEPDTYGIFGPFVTEDGWVRWATPVIDSISPRSVSLTAEDSGGRQGFLKREAPSQER